jgi:hypothetical protein
MPQQLPGPRSPEAEELSICGVCLLDGVWLWPGSVGHASMDQIDALLRGAGGTPGSLAGTGSCLG